MTSPILSRSIKHVVFMKKTLKIKLSTPTPCLGCPKAFTSTCGIAYRQ